MHAIMFLLNVGSIILWHAFIGRGLVGALFAHHAYVNVSKSILVMVVVTRVLACPSNVLLCSCSDSVPYNTRPACTTFISSTDGSSVLPIDPAINFNMNTYLGIGMVLSQNTVGISTRSENFCVASFVTEKIRPKQEETLKESQSLERRRPRREKRRDEFKLRGDDDHHARPPPAAATDAAAGMRPR